MSEERKEKFTAGPWRVGISAASKFSMMNYYVFAEREFDPEHPFAPELFICRTDSTIVERDAGEKEANAALIAAAPEMYAALAEAVEKYGKPGGPWNVPSEPGSWIEKAKNALKKARGEEC